MVLELKDQAMQMGLDLFGTANVATALPKDLKRLPYAVSIGVHLLDAVTDEVVNGPTHTYFHHYRTVNAFLDQCALKLALTIQRGGYRALNVPASQTVDGAGIAGLFPHKTAAVMAGLGFIGKSCLFISGEFGPRVRLATVLTNLPLPEAEIMQPQCGNCMACVKACKSGALYGEVWTQEKRREDMMDAKKCSNYMKEKYKDIGRGAVCGICMAVCPFGGKTK